MRFAICILGAEIFAFEFTNDEEVEEIDVSDTARLTTSDHSFGFTEESTGYWEDEERA